MLHYFSPITLFFFPILKESCFNIPDQASWLEAIRSLMTDDDNVGLRVNINYAISLFFLSSFSHRSVGVRITLTVLTRSEAGGGFNPTHKYWPVSRSSTHLFMMGQWARWAGFMAGPLCLVFNLAVLWGCNLSSVNSWVSSDWGSIWLPPNNWVKWNPSVLTKFNWIEVLFEPCRRFCFRCWFSRNGEIL